MRRASLIAAVLAIACLASPDAFGAKRRAVRHPRLGEVLPVVMSDGYPAAMSSPLVIPAPGVLANDTLNGATIKSYGSTTGAEQTTAGNATPTAQGGELRLNANGSFTYDPAGAFTGNDTFKYVLANAAGTSSAEVTLMVIAPPNAVDDSYNTPQDSALNVSPSGVLANDTLNGATITSYGSTGSEQSTIGANTVTASNGTVALNGDGSFSYTPANAFSGNDSFKYRITNGGGNDTATVTIAVQATAQVDFVVTSPSSGGYYGDNTPYFAFSGIPGENPQLSLQRGRTYRFDIRTDAIHPFEILDAPPGSVTNNNISRGILTFAVPGSTGTYRYHCSIHEFGNTITTVP